MTKIRCICPCCGQIGYVSVEAFEELQKFALLRGQIVEVLPEEKDELTEMMKSEGLLDEN